VKQPNSAFALTGNIGPQPGMFPQHVSEAAGAILQKGLKGKQINISEIRPAVETTNSDRKASPDTSMSQELEQAAKFLSARRNETFRPIGADGPVQQNARISASELIKEIVKPTSANGLDLVQQTDPKTVSSDAGFEPVFSVSRPDMAQRSEAEVQLVRKIQQVVRQEIQTNLSADKTWKLHNFSMNDGSRIQLAFRQLEGILQLQLSSMNQDLNRLIQMNVQEIRDYLQNEMGLDIDLQFDENKFANGEQAESGNPSGPDNTAAVSSERRSSSHIFENQNAADRARFFGFNDNEWTA
jgi:hypothetical protein